MPLIVIVEDRETQRRTLAATLEVAGYGTVATASAGAAMAACSEHRPEVVILDLGLPDMDGLEAIPRLLERSPLSRIVVLTGRDSVRGAVAALRAGARHYLVKPWDRDELLLIVAREVAAAFRHDAVERRERSPDLFWGSCTAMRAVLEHVARLAESPTTPILIEGETGTGKEMIAREVHRRTAPSGELVAINCAAVPADLIESELFGHERGAFTGADSRQRGLVELAAEGTLFLDEIGEMSQPLQAKLLRFMADGSFRRLGGEREERIQCRVIAATHQDLAALSRSGGFRQDLYYRLGVVRLVLASLRDRAEDLLPLAHFLLESTASRLARRVRPFSPTAEDAILQHDWPGNVRELANRIERALVLGSGSAIEPVDLDLGVSERTVAARHPVLTDPARLRALLEEERFNVSRVARRLGVERHHVRYRMQQFALRRPATESPATRRTGD